MSPCRCEAAAGKVEAARKSSVGHGSWNGKLPHMLGGDMRDRNLLGRDGRHPVLSQQNGAGSSQDSALSRRHENARCRAVIPGPDDLDGRWGWRRWWGHRYRLWRPHERDHLRRRRRRGWRRLPNHTDGKGIPRHITGVDQLGPNRICRQHPRLTNSDAFGPRDGDHEFLWRCRCLFSWWHRQTQCHQRHHHHKQHEETPLLHGLLPELALSAAAEGSSCRKTTSVSLASTSATSMLSRLMDKSRMVSPGTPRSNWAIAMRTFG